MTAEPTLSLTVDELLTTTRSVRKRLDLEKPVPREVIMECLDLALQAPTGSNTQGWQWVFVEDPAKKKALADIYRANANPYLSLPAPERGDIRDQQIDAVMSSAKYLTDNFEKAPVLMVPCLEGRPDGAPAGIGASYWGSLLPAVWSFMLALRSRGLGSAWTTLHLLGDGEKQAAELLGIPFDQYAQAGLFPIAYTKGTDFKKAKRLPAEQFSHWDSW
ncbi:MULTISPECIES: nitroreductase family protein [unclassified Mycolicibacterium]|uniref:nitroreductase family protein n=1 Tax=unclassified Mycolicibacterium TaxID=2636767 RepID=UPI0012DCD663|nr:MULTISPECIES: nitroreductase family protein [unclassified Mycolicibacterium]MUL81192.1 nitroreductase family protein [Mycolicibacterium sp. CBMA 329]MUL86958.1 nitroreductase family protein [Mycolicibacterium sp. CBMA 331]MUL98758.1 nitroreductase family protein [Mycolicibacterium sp. CBMA 334]MUM25618.1 nitroreductase family protein [Mycolicibacterium sp. CBMA 295]MUM37255.1 nitroreductase family protein [Mycolicibacterium sp. CBMA 247]